MRIITRIGSLDTITLWRVRKQIEDTAPEWVEFTDELKADAQIILAIGAAGVAPLVNKIPKMPTILLQLCYQTTEMGPEFWDALWKECLMVGSYFDLDAPNFVRFPMGYDPNIFYPNPKTSKRYDAIVFGDLDGPEEIKSIHDAFGIVAHVGRDMDLGTGYINFQNIPDDRLRQIYQQSRFCIGLRRVEGFEMPIVEGAACGCFPITFDYDCYRHWFNGMAIFLDPEIDVADQLRGINSLGAHSPRHDLAIRFAQDNAWAPFWDKLFELTTLVYPGGGEVLDGYRK